MNATQATRAGQWFGTYQAVSPAPLSYIQGSRSRPLDGHLVTGSWSDPWWLYGPGQGWAVARRWRNRDTHVMTGWQDHRAVYADFPARDEIVVEVAS